MALRIAIQLNNGGRAYHDIYIRSTPMSWPSDVPVKNGTLEPGANQYLANVSATDPWYILVVAREGDKQAPSAQWFYDPVSEEFRDGGYYLDGNGDVRNDYEYLKSEFVFSPLVIDRDDHYPTEVLNADFIFDIDIKDLWDTDKYQNDTLNSDFIFSITIKNLWEMDKYRDDTLNSDFTFSARSIWRRNDDYIESINSNFIFTIEIKEAP